MLTLQNVEQEVGSIKHLNQAAALAALGALLSIPYNLYYTL